MPDEKHLLRLAKARMISALSTLQAAHLDIRPYTSKFSSIKTLTRKLEDFMQDLEGYIRLCEGWGAATWKEEQEKGWKGDTGRGRKKSKKQK